jgi:hypothetical protein
MAHWRRGDKGEAAEFFQRGVEAASKKEMLDTQSKMFWSEAAGAAGKKGSAIEDWAASKTGDRVTTSRRM